MFTFNPVLSGKSNMELELLGFMTKTIKVRLKPIQVDINKELDILFA
jgi:hypothetical protein